MIHSRLLIILFLLFSISCVQKSKDREPSNFESKISLLNCYKKSQITKSGGYSKVNCETNEIAITGGCSIPDYSKGREFLKIETSTPVIQKNDEPYNIKVLRKDLREDWKAENNFKDGHISGWECKFGRVHQSIGLVPSLSGLESHVVCCK